jgi:hypothetical protein
VLARHEGSRRVLVRVRGRGSGTWWVGGGGGCVAARLRCGKFASGFARGELALWRGWLTVMGMSWRGGIVAGLALRDRVSWWGCRAAAWWACARRDDVVAELARWVVVAANLLVAKGGGGSRTCEAM